MHLSVICAAAENGVIGRGGGLPWHLPGELEHFKRTTMGRPLIMGRRTFESIRWPLPGRIGIVVSRNPGCGAGKERVVVVPSLERALEQAERSQDEDGILNPSMPSEEEERRRERERETTGQPLRCEAFVIGGAALFEAALPLARRFHLTRVHREYEGDTYLAGFDESEWENAVRPVRVADSDPPYTVFNLKRRAS